MTLSRPRVCCLDTTQKIGSPAQKTTIFANDILLNTNHLWSVNLAARNKSMILTIFVL